MASGRGDFLKNPNKNEVPAGLDQVPQRCPDFPMISAKCWCRKRDSNPRPHHYE
jgi:hypothetical protein